MNLEHTMKLAEGMAFEEELDEGILDVSMDVVTGFVEKVSKQIDSPMFAQNPYAFLGTALFSGLLTAFVNYLTTKKQTIKLQLKKNPTLLDRLRKVIGRLLDAVKTDGRLAKHKEKLDFAMDVLT